MAAAARLHAWRESNHVPGPGIPHPRDDRPKNPHLRGVDSGPTCLSFPHFRNLTRDAIPIKQR